MYKDAFRVFPPYFRPEEISFIGKVHSPRQLLGTVYRQALRQQPGSAGVLGRQSGKEGRPPCGQDQSFLPKQFKCGMPFTKRRQCPFFSNSQRRTFREYLVPKPSVRLRTVVSVEFSGHITPYRIIKQPEFRKENRLSADDQKGLSHGVLPRRWRVFSESACRIYPVRNDFQRIFPHRYRANPVSAHSPGDLPCPVRLALRV